MDIIIVDKIVQNWKQTFNFTSMTIARFEFYYSKQNLVQNWKSGITSLTNLTIAYMEAIIMDNSQSPVQNWK